MLLQLKMSLLVGFRQQKHDAITIIDHDKPLVYKITSKKNLSTPKSIPRNQELRKN
jgi:hypothetical protein